MSYTYFFMKTNVWQKSLDLTALIYQKSYKIENRYSRALCDQLRRASLSVPTNIAEGLSKESFHEQRRFFGISYASLMEVISLTLTAEKLSFISSTEKALLLTEIDNIAKLINGYRKYLRQKIKQ